MTVEICENEILCYVVLAKSHVNNPSTKVPKATCSDNLFFLSRFLFFLFQKVFFYLAMQVFIAAQRIFIAHCGTWTLQLWCEGLVVLQYVGSQFPSSKFPSSKGSNPHPLHRKVDSQPLDHQGSPFSDNLNTGVRW